MKISRIKIVTWLEGKKYQKGKIGKKKLTNREYFSSYLTGIFEASGCITTPNKKWPHIYISFHQNNRALAEALRERIGYGAIYKKSKNISYEIFNKEGILKFIEITKDYLRSPKIREYNKMLEYLNPGVYKYIPTPVGWEFTSGVKLPR